MLNKTLIITLGITGLSSVLLFLYFRNKLNEVEEKIETMFQVIQNYDNKESQISLTEGSIPPEILHQMQQQEQLIAEQQMQQQIEQQNQCVLNPNNELITVSDKNSDSDESESDTDESDTDESDTDESDIEEEKQLKVSKDDNLEVTTHDVEELNNLNLKVENTTENNDEEEIFIEDKDDEDESDDDESDDDENKKIVVDESKEIKDLKVAELKKICRDKGLSGYKNLRKNDLIELLNNN